MLTGPGGILGTTGIHHIPRITRKRQVQPRFVYRRGSSSSCEDSTPVSVTAHASGSASSRKKAFSSEKTLYQPNPTLELMESNVL